MKLLRFPSRHLYTFPKIETQSHPLLNDCKHTGPAKEGRVHNKDYAICKRIAEASKIYSGRYFADGEWKWLNENRRTTYLTALHASDIDALSQIYSNLFRQDASYGIVSGTYTEFCDATQGLAITNGIL